VSKRSKIKDEKHYTVKRTVFHVLRHRFGEAVTHACSRNL